MAASRAAEPVASPASVIGLLVAAAILYFAKEVLLPLALAVLIAFMLAPVVEYLERLKLGRVPATMLVSLVALALVASIGTVAAMQAVSLAAKLPEYRHTIVQKIHALRAPKQGLHVAWLQVQCRAGVFLSLLPLA